MKKASTANQLDPAQEGGEAHWSLVREVGIEYLPSAQQSSDDMLRFPVYAERGADGTYLIVDDLSIGKYLTHSTRCRTVRVNADGAVLFDSSEFGKPDGYGCFMDNGRIALIARSGSELTIVSNGGAVEKKIDLSSFSKGLPRLVRWTWKNTFLIAFLIRTGHIDIIEITPSARLVWYMPRSRTLEIGFVGSIELLRNDHVLLIDELHHVALEISRSGRTVWAYGRRDRPSLALDCLANPKAVCDGGDGSRLIADTRNHRILRIATDGSVGELRAADANFCSPSFVARSGDQRFLLCDAGNRRVIEINAAGLTTWQYGPGLGNGRWFSFPRSVEIFEGGYLVADTANDRVVHMSGGEPRELCSKATSDLFWPRCARSLVSGSLLIADGRNSRIIEVSRDGAILKELGSTDVPPDLELRDPHDVTVLESGHLMLVDPPANRVIECSWSGEIYRVLGGGDGSVELSDPHSVQPLPDGHVLISDTRNNRIIRLDKKGSVVKIFEAFRSDSGFLRFFRPRHVELAPDGSMVVADSDNNRISAATLNGELLWTLTQIPESPLPYINQPRWVHAPSSDEILISDHHHHRIVHLRRR